MVKGLLLLLGFAVGAMMPLQSAMNAYIARTTQNGLFAVFANFAVGVALLAVLMLGYRERWPAPAAIEALPWWTWTAGVLGTVFVTTAMFLVPRIGAGPSFTVIVAGQLCASLIVDHHAVLGVAQHPVSFLRVAGIALILLGVVVIQRN
jgi:transporter family-2 protein